MTSPTVIRTRSTADTAIARITAPRITAPRITAPRIIAAGVARSPEPAPRLVACTVHQPLEDHPTEDRLMGKSIESTSTINLVESMIRAEARAQAPILTNLVRLGERYHCNMKFGIQWDPMGINADECDSRARLISFIITLLAVLLVYEYMR
jgi:hypothetical protein